MVAATAGTLRVILGGYHPGLCGMWGTIFCVDCMMAAIGQSRRINRN
jgi:hypothetical protein